MRTGRVLFVGDVHLHPDRPEIAARFGRFLDEEAPSAEAVYCIGDLFETWVSPWQRRDAFYADALGDASTLQLCRDLRKGHTPIVLKI